ncbi:Helix-turn-helix domain-containing protein [Rhodovastum atsumiense]|uniref:Helix-turn-helix domain-containing protein n=1 Tax=Rhodovastum atsumiense TaxID=504468 RepID=A0A5M6INJ8_9PROT|nr:helix-turn-helix domain-containing protein [Rhodovastum atsumiense]CAH2603760.1 Helix-turn-helix domain-containing protein [Rhodovastum atsumiense]
MRNVTADSLLQAGYSEPSAGGLLTTAGAAAWLGVRRKALERWRCSGGGPPFVRLGRKTVRYRVRDLEAYVACCVRTSTADG